MYDVLGYISIFFHLSSFLTQNKKKMRSYGALSALFFAGHIYGYNGINGMFVSIISLITKLLTLRYEEKKLKILHFLSLPIAIIFFIFFNPEGIIGILPALSIVFIIIADLQTNILKMKYIYYGSTLCWLIYAIVLNSIPAILYDISGIIILTYTIYKIK